MTYSTVGTLFLALCGTVADAAPAPTPVELVRQLGDASFDTRRNAAHELALIGRAAVPALEAGLKSTDAEVRRRCAELLPAARRTDEEIRQDEFIADSGGKMTLPGWPQFLLIGGNDADARRLFVELKRAEPALVELLAKDGAKVGAQRNDRCQRLGNWQVGLPGKGPRDVKTGEVVAMLLSSALAPPNNAGDIYKLTNLAYRNDIRLLVQGNKCAQRLMTAALTPAASQENMLGNVIHIASQMGLTDLRDKVLAPTVRKMLESHKPESSWQFNQACYLANQLGLEGLLQEKARPAVRKLAEAAAKPSVDQNRLYQILNLAQTLGMRDTLDTVIKPAAMQVMATAADNLNDINRIYMARHLSQSLGLSEAFDKLVKPSACRVIAEMAGQGADQNKIQQAMYLAQFLNMEAAYEGVLRPAARRLILADLEQADVNFNNLLRSAQLAQQLRMSDLMNDTFKPVVRRHVLPLKDQPPDANRIQQAFHIAQALGEQDLIKEAIKPAFGKLCQAAKDKKPDPGSFNGLLNLARSLGAKEAVPMVLQGALAKEIQPWDRATAAFMVGEHGTKEEVAKLEGLLKDTANCGSCGVNSTTINAELRDVALAMLIFRSGQSLADYGFPYFQIVPGANPFQSSPCFMGFSGSSDRDVAFKKWQAHQAASKKK